MVRYLYFLIYIVYTWHKISESQKKKKKVENRLVFDFFLKKNRKFLRWQFFWLSFTPDFLTKFLQFLKFFWENFYVMRICCKHYMFTCTTARSICCFESCQFQGFYQFFESKSLNFMRILLNWFLKTLEHLKNKSKLFHDLRTKGTKYQIVKKSW